MLKCTNCNNVQENTDFGECSECSYENLRPMTKEEIAKDIMESSFVPNLHIILRKANPTLYKQWGGNACRQTAILGTVLLRKLLPNYTWTAWDGDFSDVVHGQKVKYNHAWIHGVDKEQGKGLLVDLSRLHHERLFIEVKSNKYPKNHPSYKHMRLIRKEQMNVEEMLQDKEYYTGLTGLALVDKIVKEMGKEGVQLYV